MSVEKWLKKLELNTYEVNLLGDVVGVKTKKSFKLPKLKSLRRLQQRLKEAAVAEDKLPPKPLIPDPKNGESYDQEEQKELNGKLREWQQKLEEIFAQPTDFRLTTEEYYLVKEFMESVEFSSDKGVVEKVCLLAEKLRL